MSTTLLYHGFLIKGYQYIRTIVEKGILVFRINQNGSGIRCPVCRSWEIKRRGTKLRRFRHLPIGLKSFYIELPVQRVECLKCKIVRQVKINFANPRKSYTKAFERYALELSRKMTILDVAKHLNISWDVVKDIQKLHLRKKYAKPKLKRVKYIAIDEICIGKGHKYLTVVLNLLTGAVIFVGDGKGMDALDPFWKRLKRSSAKIKAVAVDMSPAYTSAVLENLPDASIVYDHFHVVKLYNDALTKIRRKLANEAENVLNAKVLKGTRWLLLKNPENLNKEKNEKERLEKALKLNKVLATAYYLKEDLRQFWNFKSKKEACEHLDSWIKKAKSTRITELHRIANTLAAHRTGLVNYFDHPITTGPLEGINNKIKTLKRQVYGFRDKSFFKLKIMALHQSRYALIG